MDAGPEADLKWSSTVGDSAIIVSGTIADAAAPLFFRVADARFLSDGSIAVANTGTSEVIVVDAAGSPRSTIGGPGDGPGEFRGIESLVALPNGGIRVYDRAHLRFSEFDEDGQLVRDQAVGFVPLDGVDRPFFSAILSGTEVIGFNSSSPQTADPIRHEVARVGLFDLETEQGQVLYSMTGATWITFELEGRSMIRHQPLTSRPSWSARGDRLATTSGASSSITVIDLASREVTEVAAPRRRQAVTAESIDWWKTPLAAALAEQGGPVEPFFDAMTYPDSLPVYESLVIDDVGYIWAGLFRGVADSGWDVFSPTGSYECSVRRPGGMMREFEIRRSDMLGVRTDSLGVEYVVVHPLTRNGDSPCEA